MFELVLLAVIGVGLYRKHGENWEWSRARLASAFRGLSRRSDDAVHATRASLPTIVAQCREDLRSLGDDLLGLFSPSARQVIERRTRTLIERGARHGRAGLRPPHPAGRRLEHRAAGAVVAREQT